MSESHKYTYNYDYLLKLQNGLTNINKIHLYSKDNKLFLIMNSVRMFCVSFLRLKKTMSLSLNEIFYIIVKNIDTINFLNPPDTNNVFLVIKNSIHNHNHKYIFEYKIKLKEINKYLDISNKEEPRVTFLKQKEKIKILLKKLEIYENKYHEPTTDEEFL